MRTSYHSDDVTLLLKDISAQIEPEDTLTREKKIQSGTHYSEMLPLEYQPTPEYMALYEEALALNGAKTAQAVRVVAEKIAQEKSGDIVLVSLARAGLPIGILIKHYLERYLKRTVCHYGLSIIRGRGIDQQAMQTILKDHPPQSLQFVDGWTGKGAILHELRQALADYPEVSARLAVLADPAQITDLCGTYEDFLIPSACLNATVSGLVSRTVLNDHLIGPEDYHGAVYYEHLQEQDLSYHFIETIEAYFPKLEQEELHWPQRGALTGMEEVAQLAETFNIHDINLIKPGIGETTRVLLRRVPWKILVSTQCDPRHLAHIYRLAEEKNVLVEPYDLRVYNACGLIKDMKADI